MMKKRLFVAILLFLSVYFVQAQKIGFVAGYTASYNYVDIPDYDIDFNQSLGSGYHFGGMLEWNFTPRWGLDLSLLYEIRNSRYNLSYVSDTTTRLNRTLQYLDLPVHFFMDFKVGKILLSPYVGGAICVGLAGKDKAWMDVPTERPVLFLDSDMYDKDDGHVNRWDLKGEAGLAAKYKHWQFRATYSMSLVDTSNDEFKWTLDVLRADDKSFYQGEAKFSICYLFDLKPDYTRKR